ncbi:MAG TPA: alpha/beta hydrolase [Thermotogota bacterium]|nr:alpha/beta hydrolase [Thermotogota bacterium]HQQ66478.1 alpha/beta hydrolase [Thermotogota bacterium]
MKQELLQIGAVPAIVYGEPSEKVYLFAHGQCGYKEEAKGFAEIVLEKGWQVLSVDLPEHGERKNETNRFFPWIVVPELRIVWEYLISRWERIAIRANSIGAWFSLLAFPDITVEKSLFVSPILDMERLIRDMMTQACVTETELETKKTIPTTFGPTLSWEYWLYAKRNPIREWQSLIKILYGGRDAMTGRETLDAFCARFKAELTVMENGEHWFHTGEQLSFLRQWEEQNG